jgi:ABC-type antimicrobial peptide transport system permease subunit
VVDRIGRAIASADPDVSVGVHPLNEVIAESLTQDRVLAIVSASVGALALLLAALGLYGAVAYGVTRRRRELGIRLALGATAAHIVRLVLGRVAALVAVGLCAGAILSAWASRLIVALLYDVGPRDPVTFVSAALVFAAVAAVATWLPTRRAVGIDPALILRCE